MSGRRGRPGPPPKWGEPVEKVPSRLPQGMLALLKAEAARLGCSLNDVLVLRLAEAMKYTLPVPAQAKPSSQEALPLIDKAHVAA